VRLVVLGKVGFPLLRERGGTLFGLVGLQKDVEPILG
jgi:hypothetical protein